MSQQEKNRLCLSMQTNIGWHMIKKILFLSTLVQKSFCTKYSFFEDRMYLYIKLYIFASSPVTEIYLIYLKVPSQLVQQRCDNAVRTSLLTLSQRCDKVENESCADVGFQRYDNVVTTFSIGFLGHFATDYSDFFPFIETWENYQSAEWY